MANTETKELLKFVIDLGLAFEKSLSDGDLSVFDAANFVSSMLDLSAAFEGIQKIPEEIKNMAEADIKELYAFVKEQLDLAGEHKAEDVIAQFAEIGMKIYKMVVFIRDNKASSLIS